jgi:uncharacterized protein (UPF0333 family)
VHIQGSRSLVNHVVVSVIVLFAILISRSSIVRADETDAAKAAAEADTAAKAAAGTRLEEAMKSLDLFYKVGKTETGDSVVTVMYESEGSTSKITCSVRSIGRFAGKTVYALVAWTTITSGESALPPNVIKLVATENEAVSLGQYSMSQDYKAVYSNCTIPLDETTSDGMVALCLAHTNVNASGLKKKIDAIVSAGTTP